MALDYDRIKSWPIPAVRQQYGWREAILYALSVGAAGSEPVRPEELKYVYEGTPGGLRALPTMAVVLASPPHWLSRPESGLDYARALHGEQYLTLHAPLPSEAIVSGQDSVEEIYDKGADKGALLYLKRELRLEPGGEPLATLRSGIFLRRDGGFGGRAAGAPAPYPVPTRTADATLDLQTRPEQAAWYRLNGDLNPLHIDPVRARTAGFERPILHGLCTYGIAGRACLRLLCADVPARLRAFNVRFVRPVFPGETLRVEIWHTAPGVAALRLRVVERDIVALDHGYVEYRA